MSNETAISGFWSYARKDDEAESGRITNLGRDLAREYELRTGQTIDLFLDRDSVAWGERWREAIDSGVENSAFFVAVMTPTYFQREECRNELETFARSARDLGVRELVLPLRYIDFPDLDGTTTEDHLIRLATEFQWQDWSDTRFADRESEVYRRGVGAMAEGLAEVNRALDRRAALDLATPTPLDVVDQETPGTLDLMEAAERVLPEWQATTVGLSEEVAAVGEIFRSGTERLSQQESRGKATFAGRVAVARHVAQDLVPHAERIRDLGTGFVEQMHEVDAGVQAMLKALANESPADDDAAEQVCNFLRAMAQLAASMREGLGQMDRMLVASEELARQSRDLRLPIGVMKQGLTAIRQGQAVADNWDRLISETDVDCARFGDDTDTVAS